MRGLVLLGVDGGGSRCRARLADLSGKVLGEGVAGPANMRWGLDLSLRAVQASTAECLAQAGLQWGKHDIVACLALAGVGADVNSPGDLSRVLHFRHTLLTTDAQAACIGAHAGRDGGIIIAGTGSIGWAQLDGGTIRVGGWGFPISDEGSGAWIGCEAIRRVLVAFDGICGWTPMLSTVFGRFGADPHQIVQWMGTARPQDYAALAPIVVEHAFAGDSEAVALMSRAASQMDGIAQRLLHLGVPRLSIVGGLADKLSPFLSKQTLAALVEPTGDSLSGALHLARLEAMRLALHNEKTPENG